jgi:RNA polymerase sigma-54 factor
MSLLQRQSQSQRLQQRADPQLLLTNRLLQMSTLELRQCVLHELAENPALDSSEETECGGQCDFPAARCLTCPTALVSTRWDRHLDPDEQGLPRTPGELDTDPFATVEAPETLQEYLTRQFHALSSSQQEVRAGRYLVAGIDDDGYLRGSVEEAAELAGVSVEVAQRALELIQSLDPNGVGARTLHECLLIQARSSQQEASTPPHLTRLLESCWKEIGSGKWKVAARRLQISVREVEETVAWLRKNLSPYPGRQFRPEWGGQRIETWVRPDALVRKDENGRLVLEMARGDSPSLHVNPQYARLWDEMRARPDAFDPAERKHLQDYLSRAQMFLKSVRDRGAILKQVCECLLDEQERYFQSEAEEDMRPLTQSQVASFLRVHESTVSRAVAEKYLQLPSGRVVPMSYFFDRALSHRALVARVLAAENPAHPYSDQEIADLLRRQGVIIARRTVMKYREEMNILSSRQRGRAARV